MVFKGHHMRQNGVIVVVVLILGAFHLLTKTSSQAPERLPTPFELSNKVGSGPLTDAKSPRMAELPVLVSTLGDPSLLHRLYTIESRQGRVVVPDTFQEKVKGMFKNYPGGSSSLHFVESQTIITTYNKYTAEHSLFNEIRRYRPGYREKLSEEEETALQNEIKAKKGEKCDFCNMERTAADIFGRIVSKHCYISANVAKYEKWHSLLIAKEHSPLVFTHEMVQDYVRTARSWYQKVYEIDSTATAPHLMWDSTGRASASQIHQHMQLSVTNKFYTRAEMMRRSSAAYQAEWGGNMWADMALVHDQLGLAVRKGDCVLMASLTPIKERELIVVGYSDDSDFAALWYVALAALRSFGTRSFSSGVVFEPLDNPRSYPAVARVVDRGAPSDIRNDVGAMELYGSFNVGQDPFDLMPTIREELRKLG
eukprot:Sspe_Gene.89057::Locus_60921_Transcript_1_1_Confidence_1.000_Length_1369::g.89057::m.89057